MDFENAIPIFNSVAHGAVQMAVALGAGGTLDLIFDQLMPTPKAQKISSYVEALQEALEASAQVMLGSVLLGLVMNYLIDLPSSSADPAAGQIFANLFMQTAQPSLQRRLGRLMQFVRDRLLQPEAKLIAKFNGAFRENSEVANPIDASYSLRKKVMKNNGMVPPSLYDNADHQSSRKIANTTSLRKEKTLQ
jgi:hypothetical protein